MIQALMINGTSVEYSINTDNIIAVLGRAMLPDTITYEAMLQIVYLGLRHAGGYTRSAFITAVQKDEIYPSHSRKHYAHRAIRQRILARIRQAYRGVPPGKIRK